MMWDWYKIINKAEFEALNIPSREVESVLEGIGLKTILVVKGAMVSLIYNGVMLSPGLNDKNPFVFDGYAAYLKEDGYIYLGVPSED